VSSCGDCSEGATALQKLESPCGCWVPHFFFSIPRHFTPFPFKALGNPDDEERAREVPHFVSVRPKLGEIVLRAGAIDEMQLDAALGEQKMLGEQLGQVLIRLGYVTEQELVQALASQLNLPVATLDGKKIPQRVLDIVPVEFAHEHTCIPLFQKQEEGVETLYIGMDNPSNLDVLDDLAFRTGMRVKPVVVATSEIISGVDRFYRDLEPDSELGTEPASEAPEDQDEPAPPDFATELIVESRDTNPFDDEVVLLADDSSELPQLEVELVEDEMPAEPVEPAPQATSEPSTRLVLHALTQIFIEKGIVSREELQQRVSALSGADEGDQDEA